MNELSLVDVCNHEIVQDVGGALDLFHDGSPPEVMRRRIDALTVRLLELNAMPPPPVEHELLDGMYFRKLFIPKGTLLVGKVHLKPCVNIVASGDITVLTEFGCRRLAAGYSGISQRGIQKVGLAHEDTVFVNVFRTDKVDLAAIEDELFGMEHVPTHIDEDRADYNLFLAESGLTEVDVVAIVDDMSDHADLPPGEYSAILGASRIGGDGMFAIVDIERGEFIGPASIEGRRTVFGRMMNHSKRPNTLGVMNGNGADLYASRRIRAGEELTINYRDSLRLAAEIEFHPEVV